MNSINLPSGKHCIHELWFFCLCWNLLAWGVKGLRQTETRACPGLVNKHCEVSQASDHMGRHPTCVRYQDEGVGIHAGIPWKRREYGWKSVPNLSSTCPAPFSLTLGCHLLLHASLRICPNFKIICFRYIPPALICMALHAGTS